MKLPNGYGSVYKLSGKRRNPWAARKTIGFKEGKDGKQIPQYLFVGYYKTRSEAMDALSAYNLGIENSTKNEVSVMKRGHTFEEAYELFEEYIENRSWNYRRLTKYTKKHFAPMMPAEINSLSLSFVQHVFDTADVTPSTLARMKIILHQVLVEAVKHEWIPAGKEQLATYIELKRKYVAKKKEVFTEEEIELMWDHASDSFPVRCVLFLIYTGLRRNEFLDMAKDDIDMVKHTVNVKKSKTAAGVRSVPIHDRVLPFAYEMAEIGFRETQFQRGVWSPAMELLGITGKTTHTSRHTCITRLVEAGVDARIVKTIVGHSGGNITDDVYTHISDEVLVKEINRLK